jgi:exoribonuclease R
MLLANIAAAQQIAVALPEQALLRRHDAPIDRRLVRPIVLVTHPRLMRSPAELAG